MSQNDGEAMHRHSRKILGWAITLAAASLLAACGGGGSGGITPDGGTLAHLAGVYFGRIEGQASTTTTPNAIFIVDASGRYIGYNDDSTVIGGPSARFEVVSGNAFTNASTWSSQGVMFTRGTGSIAGSNTQVHGQADITGTYATGTSLTAAIQSTPVPPLDATLSLLYHAQVTDSGASFSRIAGHYSGPGGKDYVIDGLGHIAGNLAFGCSISGFFEVADASKNIYQFQLTLAGGLCDDIGLQAGGYNGLGWRQGSPSAPGFVGLGRTAAGTAAWIRFALE
ncbi:MAG: hypothetical protein HY854_02495 [Burkholderiales bacterium]|nr:hypothetical protein [Burkholderiales bacterium]